MEMYGNDCFEFEALNKPRKIMKNYIDWTVHVLLLTIF